ncbi:MAG TPA: hypothetical protein DC038_04030 [Clostridiales bacterium]|nr:hypothetical protein [Clostridiales bacterium]
MSNIKVLKAGFFTTVQDTGRIGYQKFGMPVAGVMDSFSYRVANCLVGNDEKEAVLEAAFLGPELEFQEGMVVAITGADMRPRLNGKEIPMWESFKAAKGDKLSLGGIVKGLRTYIAFGGEICVEEVNNSKSTFVKSGIGGYKGRKLMDNDALAIKVSAAAVPGRRMEQKYIPEYKPRNKIRAVLGPQDDYFTEEGINAFFSPYGYKITKEADRMGYRLEGEAIAHKDKADIISDGATFGAVQVPANGQPIILMADRQTTGGYTKIAAVISTDLPVLAQMSPGNEIIFEKVTLQEAHVIYREYERKFAEIKAQICSSYKKYEFIGPSKKMRLIVNGIEYMADVQRIE